MRLNKTYVATTFSTRLGWMAILGRDEVLRQMSMGHDSPATALAALMRAVESEDVIEARTGTWNPPLVARLKAFAQGQVDDFLDVEIEPWAPTPFARLVLRCCRRIPCGQTVSYGELARLAKRPGAARAVGSIMSTNRIPLIVPCHRVVLAGGKIASYAPPASLEFKRRLLALEAQMAPSTGPLVAADSPVLRQKRGKVRS